MSVSTIAGIYARKSTEQLVADEQKGRRAPGRARPGVRSSQRLEGGRRCTEPSALESRLQKFAAVHR
jgi:hypothetical protein